MFFSKKEEVETVGCKTCKCLLKKKDAFIVKEEKIITAYILSGSDFFPVDDLFYCQVHKPPYNRIISFYDISFNKYIQKFYREVEVAEDGEPVGYKKKKSKTQF